MPVYKWSKTAASNASADSTINWAEGQAPSSVNDSARAEMAAAAKWRDDISGTLTTTGSSTAYALTTNSVFDTAANMSGAMITFIPHATSGAAPTLAVDGLTARQIRSATGSNVATGALIAGTPYQVTYIHASTEFILMGYTEVFGVATITGTLGVTGAATFSSTVGITGNLSVNTNKFTVTAASGNTLVAGTFDVTGNLAVNTNKFTVAASSGDTVVAGTIGVTGAATLSSTLGVTGNVSVNTNKFNVTAASGNAASAGSVLSSSASGGVGYSAGAGSTVTQLTNKSTGVTINAICGQITMNNAALGGGGFVSFTVTNSAVAGADVVILNHFATGTAGAYTLNARTGSGSMAIDIRNNTAGSLSEAIVIAFAVIKAVTS